MRRGAGRGGVGCSRVAEATSWRQISMRRVEWEVRSVSERGRRLGGGLVEWGGDGVGAGEYGILADWAER